MIYEFPGLAAPIRQGDIFQSIPRVDLNLSKLPVLEDGEASADDWLRVSSTRSIVNAVVAMRPVHAIIITQDCDTVRVSDIALCEIDLFDVVDPSGKGAKYPIRTMSFITKQARLNLKWFYLPPDPAIRFTHKMAVDFHSVLSMSRTYLENNLAHLRLGRLNAVATEHFRERLSEYYRRYPYDEWYPLDKAEFEEYRRTKSEPIDPYPWQK